MIENYMNVEEAAEYLKYTKRSVRSLCDNGKLPGAKKFGERVWAIPEESVKNYVKGLQGFALKKAKRDAARQMELDAINAEIRRAASQKKSVQPCQVK